MVAPKTATAVPKKPAAATAARTVVDAVKPATQAETSNKTVPIMINTADNKNSVGGAGVAGQQDIALEKSNSLIYLGAAQTANQSGTSAAAAQQAVGEVDRVKQMGELSQQERKQLRLARFGKGKDQIPGLQEAATTIEALELIEEQKRKKLERAERFGIVTKELSEKRIKERQERFGIQTKESIEAKKQERMKRMR